MLFVAQSDRWRADVRAAACAEGFHLLTCRPDNAVSALVGLGADCSHVLIETPCDERLLDDLAGLTNVGDPDGIVLVLLEKPNLPRSWVDFVPSVSIDSVRAALARRPAANDPGKAAMHEKELRAALTGSMVEARYQPIVRMADRRLVAIEALARLNHPSHGTILPDLFVPQVEDAGLAPELTEAVSARALADLAGPVFASRNISVSLNFPLDVILLPRCLEMLETQRRAAGVPSSRIVVELTESRPVEDFAALRRSVEHLRDLGYHVGIDDVGPAMPLLEPLLDLPFNGIKLDKGLVQDAQTDRDADAFMGRVISGAKARKMMVVAEGVETQAIWDRVQALGVDLAQGFLVARPLTIAALPAWMNGWQGG